MIPNVKWTCLLLLTGATGLPLQPGFAQGYPAKPVRVVAPFPAGGGTDLFARAVAQRLTAVMGQTFLVDNRSGAGGMIGADLIAKAPPDGYSLLITSSSTHSINPHLTRKMAYDALRDFVPVINIASAPNVLVVHPSVPARTVKELIALAKSRPGALNYASNGAGTLSHLTGEMFKLQTGINLVHIPYKGGPPAIIDLVAGQVSALFTAVPTVLPQLRSGRLRAVAVTGTRRLSTMPDLPAVAENLPGFDSVQWWGMFAPAGTSGEVVDKLNAESLRIINDPEVRTRFATEGAEPVGGNPREFAAFFKADFEKWGKVVKAVGIRTE